MNFRVQRLESEGGSVIFSISGRIQAEHTETLQELLEREDGRVTLDLKDVVLVDRDAVRFLARCEATGMELRNCPAYVREWVRRETAHNRRETDSPGGTGK